MMKDLFYSPAEKILFWVAGYTQDDNTSNVYEKIQHLQNNAEQFAKLAGVGAEKVKTHFVEKSQRYKFMRCFFVETDTPPSEAFVLGNDWKMFKWLEY